jgi:hypothetical protein
MSSFINLFELVAAQSFKLAQNEVFNFHRQLPEIRYFFAFDGES